MKIPRVNLGRIGKCIYCGTAKPPLRTEHIIPYGLNGPWELRRATCDKCAAITSTFERTVQRDSLIVLRAALDFPTRRRHKRPNKFPLIISRDGHDEIVEVPVHQHLALMILPISEPPAYLDGRPYEKGTVIKGVIAVQVGGPPATELAKQLRTKSLSVSVTWHENCFERLIAKIAYGFAVSNIGIDNIEEAYVIPAILGEKDDVGRWVGCANDVVLPVGKFLHHIDLAVTNYEIIVRVKLFSLFQVPEYLVVVGRVSKRFIDGQNRKTSGGG